MTVVHTETLRTVGGQRAEGIPPGVAVMPPPARRAHSRQELYFLLQLDLGDEAASSLCREVREVAAQSFWSSASSVTAALRKAVSDANQALFHANLQADPEDRRYGGLTCVAVLDGEIFLAQAGTAWACSLCGGLLERFPRAELSPLGASSFAEVRLTYLNCQEGDTLLLAAQWFGDSVSDDALRHVLSREGMGALLDGLEQIGAGGELSAVLARWTETSPAVEKAVEGPAPVTTPAPAPEAVLEPERVEPVEVQPEAAPAPTVQVRRRLLQRRERPERPPHPPMRERLRDVGQGVAGMAGAVGGGLATLVSHMLPGQRQAVRRRTPRQRELPEEDPRLMGGLALTIMVVVVLVTVMFWFRQGSDLEHQESLSRALGHAARARETDDIEIARPYWNAVLEDLKGLGEGAEVVILREEAYAALDMMDRVVSVDPTLLWDFGPTAVFRRVVIQGQSIYLLSADSGSVYRLTLAESGERVVEQDTAPVLVATGSDLNGRDVGSLVDMAWAGPGGQRTTEALVILEESGALVVYDPAWGMNRIYLGGLPDQAAPVAQVAFRGRLYLLDPQTDQIWRYLPEDGGYPNRPEPYFAMQAPYPLDTARDMAIDGSVYILFANGSLEKYFDGAGGRLEVTGVPSPEPSFVAVAASASWTDGLLLLADTAGERVVALTSDGAFRAQLRAPEGVFGSLQALALDEEPSRLFVVAGGKLYVLDLDDIL